MDRALEKINIDANANGWLKEYLIKALDAPTIKFEEINKIDDSGLYLIFDDEELLYVGITMRSGKKRLVEMDYLSHSLSKNLLLIELNKNEIFFDPKKVKSHKELVSKGIVTDKEYNRIKNDVKSLIKTLKVKFFKYNKMEIGLRRLEHYAIAVLNPFFNT